MMRTTRMPPGLLLLRLHAHEISIDPAIKKRSKRKKDLPTCRVLNKIWTCVASGSSFLPAVEYWLELTS